jgi:hypothetical protein
MMKEPTKKELKALSTVEVFECAIGAAYMTGAGNEEYDKDIQRYGQEMLKRIALLEKCTRHNAAHPGEME